MTEINNNSNYNKNYEEIELLLHKLQVENATKNIEILKLREEVRLFRKNIKDTTSNFPLPDEFKTRWETLIKTSAMDILENISLNSILLMKVINIIIKYVYDISIVKIKQKVSDILKCLGINDIKEENIKNFFEKFKKLIFQDYFNTIFRINNNDFVKELILNIKNEIIIKDDKLFSEIDKANILKDLNGNNINKFITELFYLCLYMNINEPQLNIKTSTEINYKYYNKNIYSNIEGFSKENDICLLILNPPITKNNINYKGIKPTVCLIDNPTKEIQDLCYKQNFIDINNGKNKNSKSFSKTSNFVNYFRNNKLIKSEIALKKNNNISVSSKLILKRNISNNNFDSFIYNNVKDDFNYKYKINFENILNNINIEKKNKSYKSEFLNTSNNKFKKLYHEMKFSKNSYIINKIKNLKKNQTRNINFLSFHKSHNIPKNYNFIGKNISIKKKPKSYKSSSPISPRKCPSFFIEKDKSNIKKLISMINSRSKQKYNNYKSEKFLNRNKKKLILKRENSNMLLKIKEIKQFHEFSSYIRKRNKNIENNKEEKKQSKCILEDNNEKNNNNDKKRTFKGSLPIIKNENEINISNYEINKLKINKISIKRVNIPMTNKINQSQPYISTVVDDIKPIKKHIQIPNKNNNKMIQKEKILSKQFNYSQNKDSSNCISYLNTNCNLLTTNNNNNYKTNNSILSNYNNESSNMKNKIKNDKNIFKIINNKETMNNSSSSTSKKKIEHKKKNLSSNTIKYTLNINNNIEQKNEEIINRNKGKPNNKYNSNFVLHNKENNEETSYISIISSNSQINIHANKKLYSNIKKEKRKLLEENSKKLKKNALLLYKRNINEISSNSKKKLKQNIYKIKLNTEKNQEKSKNKDSIRNSCKGNGLDTKLKKNENINYIHTGKSYKKNNNKIINTNLLYENEFNKENKNNINIKEINTYNENISNGNRKKKDLVKHKKNHYLDEMLTFNEKITKNNL